MAVIELEITVIILIKIMILAAIVSSPSIFKRRMAPSYSWKSTQGVAVSRARCEPKTFFRWLVTA